jgi:hypothetical protein
LRRLLQSASFRWPLIAVATGVLALVGYHGQGRGQGRESDPLEPIAPFSAPRLPPPSGRVVTVGDMDGLLAALKMEGRPERAQLLTSDTTIVLRPGVYQLRTPLRIGLSRTVGRPISNITIRGATGNRDDVVIKGGGMSGNVGQLGFQVLNAQDVTIADLSIGEVAMHAVQMQGQQGADRIHLYNLHLFDTGQQFVKGDAGYNAAEPPDGVDRGLVEYSLIEYTNIGPKSGYTNGIDIHRGTDWIIRYNVFKNIRVPANAPRLLGPAVLMWSQSENSATYDNVFWNCERAIAYGLGPQPDKRGVEHSHIGGVIYNNFIYRAADVPGDAGISAWDAPSVRIAHNTVIQNGTYANAIEYRFPGTANAAIVNNLTDGEIARRTDAQAFVAGNYTSATRRLFRSPETGDLHLLPTAREAIDAGVALDDFPTDWDGEHRPSNGQRDVGADELVAFPGRP